MATITTNGIFTYAEAVAEGYSFAFVNGNRNLSAKNVTAKVKTLKEYKFNLVPIMVVEGSKAVDEGCVLVDPETGEDLKLESGYEKILAILDGQHRFSAGSQAGVKDNLRFFISYSDARVIDQLATTNIEASKWNGADFAHCAVTFQPEDEVAKFIAQLSDRGFQTATIGLILYRKGSSVTTGTLAKMVKGEAPKSGYDIKKANYFLEKAMAAGFTDPDLSKRYVINAVLRASDDHGFNAACDKLAKIKPEQRKFFLESKAAAKEDYLASILADKSGEQ